MQTTEIPPEYETFDTIDLKRLFDLLRRNLWLILLGLLLGGGLAFIASRLQTPIYAASTQVMVTRTNSQSPVSDVTQTLNAQQIAQTYVELLSQKWIAEKVAERIGSEVASDQIDVSLTVNTPIIKIQTEDPDPTRAALIADTLVDVLIEQNENIQSGRSSSAEENLNLQIHQMEAQVAAAQLELLQAKSDAYDAQLQEAQDNIFKTESVITETKAEIEKLNNLGSVAWVRYLLGSRQKGLNTLQAFLDKQLVEYQAMSDDLANNPLVKSDPAYAPSVQVKMAELGVQINDTRQKMDALSQEIDYLTPLVEDEAISKAIAEREDFLDSQETLLSLYREAYTTLQVSGNLPEPADEVVAKENNFNLYQNIYLNLLSSRETIRLERIQNMPNVVQANPAIATEEPIRPRTLLNTLLGGLAGLVLAVSVVMLIDFLDTTIKTRQDVERIAPGLSVLGYMLPMPVSADQTGPYVGHAPRSPAAESFRLLRTNLEFIGVDKPLKSILISSSNAGDGKTTLTANLGLILAQGGKRVALLDADLRRPTLHKLLGLSNRVGLTDIFRGAATVEQALQPYGETGLSIITSGGIPPNPAELIGSVKMNQVIDELESRFDAIVIDTTPTLVADSQLLAARVNGVLLIVCAGKTHTEAVRATVEQYGRVGARLLGVVLNNVVRTNGYGYSYYSTPHYYHYDHDSYDGQEISILSSLPWKRQGKSGRPNDE
ncbi:MAG: polysaccharide biosynthesis tyrosine autokinase [Anaerolineaceae bacterium]|nr:MAG: polysaccharide biosynthesis tyrosine autokinase [Anaerolineaceae bacterium]